MLVGYMRVSTAEQSLALQRDAPIAAGVEPERIYEDTCSGTVADRPGLARAINVVRAGDALVVWKLDRIGRSLAHVVELVGSLQAKGIGLKVLTGGIDITIATGRLVFGSPSLQSGSPSSAASSSNSQGATVKPIVRLLTDHRIISSADYAA